MHLENTNLAPVGSWRATKVESDLIWDIADAIGGVGERDYGTYNQKHMVKADLLLRAFIAREGRYPVNGGEVKDRFPGGFKLHIVYSRPGNGSCLLRAKKALRPGYGGGPR